MTDEHMKITDPEDLTPQQREHLANLRFIAEMLQFLHSLTPEERSSFADMLEVLQDEFDQQCQ